MSDDTAVRDGADIDRVARRIALRFVVLIGVLSFFADFTYEGSRSMRPSRSSFQSTSVLPG